MCDQKLLNNELKKYINMCAKKTITGIIKLFEILNEIKKKMVNIDKILSEKEKTKKDIDKILFALYFFFKFIEMTNLDNNFVFKILDKHIIENKIYTFFKNILQLHCFHEHEILQHHHRCSCLVLEKI